MRTKAKLCHACVSYNLVVSGKVSKIAQRKAHPATNSLKKSIDLQTKEELKEECKTNRALLREKKREVNRMNKLTESLKAR